MAPEDTAEDQMSEDEFYRGMAEVLGQDPTLAQHLPEAPEPVPEAHGEPGKVYGGVIPAGPGPFRYPGPRGSYGAPVPAVFGRPKPRPNLVITRLRVALRELGAWGADTMRQELTRLDQMPIRPSDPGAAEESVAYHLAVSALNAFNAITQLVAKDPPAPGE